MKECIPSLCFATMVLACLVLIALQGGCAHEVVGPNPNPEVDSIVNPPLSGNFVLCYTMSVAGHWNVLISGSRSLNLSVSTGALPSQDDEYPQWSPNGNFILFQRSLSVFGPTAEVFDVKHDTCFNATSDGGVVALPPGWTPSSELYCAYQAPVGTPTATYLMNPDGTQKKRILSGAANIFFYSDGHSFVYRNGSNWYRTDVDSTVNEFILNEQPGGNQHITVQDFNGTNGDFLVNTNMVQGYSSVIGTFNAGTGVQKEIIFADPGFTLAFERYSPDHSKIVFVEIGASDQYLSIWWNGAKRRLVHLPHSDPPVAFSYWPMQFSSDGQYVAFSEQFFTSGQEVSWVERLYVVDIVSRGIQSFGDGFAPSWPPQMQ